MPTPIPYAMVNGARKSPVSVELKLAGQLFIGFKSINYSRTRKRSVVQGHHPDPLGKTRGANEYKADCELWIDEWNAFQAQLGDGYGDVFFQVLVTYAENGSDTIQDVLNGCTMDSTEAGSDATSTDGLSRKFDLSPLKILFNGIDDVAQPLVGVPQ